MHQQEAAPRASRSPAGFNSSLSEFAESAAMPAKAMAKPMKKFTGSDFTNPVKRSHTPTKSGAVETMSETLAAGANSRALFSSMK